MSVIKRFYHFVWLHKKPFILSLIFIVLFSVFSNLFPVLLRDLINAAEAGDLGLVRNIFVYLTIIKILELIMQILSQSYGDFAAIQSARSAREEIFKHLHDLDFHYHANKSSGSLISAFKRGEGAFISLYVEVNTWALKVLLDFLFMSIILFSIYQKLLFLTLIIFFLNLFTMYFTIRFNIRRRGEFNKQDDKVTAITVDNMIAFDTVKYFAREKYEQNRLHNVMDKWEWYFKYYVKTFRVIDITSGGLISLGMLLAIGIAGWDFIEGKIELATFVLAVTYATLFYPSLKNLVFQFREVAKRYEDISSYLNILNEQPRVTDPDIIDEKLFKRLKTEKGISISYQNVSFSYGDNRELVLDNLDLEIKPGESVAFVGISGAGKTTMTKLLLRFYDPVTGSIRLNGTDIKSLSKEQLRSLISIVPQETVLFNDTIGYNIKYSDQNATHEDVRKACKEANLLEFIEGLPQKFDTFVGERGIKLSGGQKQRLSIARAFLENAPIIVFDEATSNLDSQSEKLIQDSFWKVSKHKTTIIIAHRLSTIQKVDRIIVFDQGQIVEQGTHAQLAKKESGIYKYLWELQTKGELE